MNYRNEARARLNAARTEVASGDDARLKYAALDLRMAMEGLTYDRALAYKDEFPPDEYQTWQPRRVMSVLLEIDATADAGSSLAIGLESEYGVPAAGMQSLGTERVLDMSALRKHYDALGSYLHLPTIKQIKKGGSVDANRLRTRCEEIAALVEAALRSPVYNITLGQFARFECARCESAIRKRLSHDNAEVSAECFQCRATYTLVSATNGQVEIRPKRHEAHCAGEGCTGVATLWEADLQPGKHWKCDVCGGRNHLVLGLQYEQSE